MSPSTLLTNLKTSIYPRKKINLFKNQLRGVSYETLQRLALENPLIPFEALQEDLASNQSNNTAIQSYCLSVLVQENLYFEGLDIIPSQELARENAALWMEELLPQMIAVPTEAKQFANLFLSLSENDIDQLVDNLSTPDGIRVFREVMAYYQSESDGRAEKIEALSMRLDHFAEAINIDLSNFRAIKEEADQLLSNKETEKPQEAMKRLSNTLVITIAVLTTIAVLGGIALYFYMGRAPKPSGQKLFLGRWKVYTRAAPYNFDAAFADYNATYDEYWAYTNELYAMEVRLASLEHITSTFDSLIQQNVDAARALTGIQGTWLTLGQSFQEIEQLVNGVFGQEDVELIRLQLKEARRSAQQLKDFATECELQAVLHVEIDEDTLRRFHLPTSRMKQAIPSTLVSNWIANQEGLLNRSRWRQRGLAASLCTGA